jgi:hypothetical protein
MEYSQRPQRDRGAYIYEIVGQPGMWRIRLQLYPEHSQGGGWYGGRILWGYDQPYQSKAQKIADDWIVFGKMPEDFCLHCDCKHTSLYCRGAY